MERATYDTDKCMQTRLLKNTFEIVINNFVFNSIFENRKIVW